MTYRRLLALSFVLNGLLLVGMKAVGELRLIAFIPIVLLFQYALATVLTSKGMLRPRQPITRAAVWVGALAGISSAIGMAASIAVAGMLPGYIVFPVIQGGTLLIVVLVGTAVFRERIGAYGIAGIIAGAAAMVLLSG